MCDSQNSPLPPTRLLQLQQQQQQQHSCLKPDSGSCSNDTTVSHKSAVLGPAQSAMQGHSVSCTAANDRRNDTLRYGPAQAVCESMQSSRDCPTSEGTAPEPVACARAVTCTTVHTQAAGREQHECCQDQAAAAKGVAAVEQSSGKQQDLQASHEVEQKRLRSLEVQHVHRVYEAIAPHFSATRCDFV
jgi:hypothetical protein